MERIAYVFENTDTIIGNDVIFPGTPYILNNFNYTVNISPFSSFWRFGIRLSTKGEIKFNQPADRYQSPDFLNENIDIHLGVGEWHEGVWDFPYRLHLAQYNIKGYDHLLYRSEDYESESKISWVFSYDSHAELLHLSVSSENMNYFETSVPIKREMRFFQFFAWADESSFKLNCEIEINRYRDEDINQIQVLQAGNIEFRHGDMMDSEALRKANVIILPAETNGEFSANVRSRASEMGIPAPTTASLGEVVLYKIDNSPEPVFAGYAYSVNRNVSNANVIVKICDTLSNIILTTPLLSENVFGLNLPLLGTGAGGLSVTEVAEVYNRCFNNKKHIPVIVSVLKVSDFEQIKKLFSGRYLTIDQLTNLEKPQTIHFLEERLRIKLEKGAYLLNVHDEIISLTLSNVNIREGEDLVALKTIKNFRFHKCNIYNTSFFLKFPKLTSLSINFGNVVDFSFLEKMKQLEVLDVSNNTIQSLDFLKSLTILKKLVARSCNIKDIHFLQNLLKLQALDLANNKIEEIKTLEALVNLVNLNLSFNRISSISPLRKLKNITFLDISNNNIIRFEQILQLTKLNYLKADNNPYVKRSELILKETENHLSALRNILLRELEAEQIPVELPAKLLLLGNHASGKTSLMKFILNGHFNETVASTHILQIEKFGKNTTTSLPEAIFFDFGGQDYYHGIYRAFLSGGAAYLILWNATFNFNTQRLDTQNFLTQDFSIEYWMSQKKYLEDEKFFIGSDPVLLIQTHADESPRKSYSNPNHFIDNQFYVSLKTTQQRDDSFSLQDQKNKHALEYLRHSIQDLIEERKLKTKRPSWFIDFLIFILNQSRAEGFESRSLDYFTPYYKRPEQDNHDFLQEDLDQLHKQGLILYYKDMLPNCVWLNPAALVNYVHETILSKAKKKDGGRLSPEDLAEYSPAVIQLLKYQKVIFEHQFGINGIEFIIPNFLPLSSESNAEFNLLTFSIGEPKFILKFLHFIPFGLINQAICFFGKLPEKKIFWRDQLLFILEDSTVVLISIDFQNLEIRTHFSSKKGLSERENSDIMKYLFFSLLGLYWDLDMPDISNFTAFTRGLLQKDYFSPNSEIYKQLNNCELLFEREACRPLDLYITLNNKNFIKYQDLCNEDNVLLINSWELTNERTFTENSKFTSAFPFQPFTNKELKRRKKVVISYSKKDLKLINKFKDYLIPLYDDELIDTPWYCSELMPGSDWDEEIGKRFSEADIIFFMVSENLMSTKYVKQKEIKYAIDRWEKDQSVKIIPILLVPYHFQRNGKYNLSRFTTLPYTLKPVVDFPNQLTAWHLISHIVRKVIESDLNPENDHEIVTSEIRMYFERIASDDQSMRFQNTGF
ncbi:C-terminal of Roc, COR, domain [Filimonas lacunae]|uniref:C-terminal of Roc, COR, domain n=1 Tax=Filimonas lacunae TaxID=477680 RepID=A0A173MC10_9BACT|nr:leucine-rich repeat domain-containing protein [Filimonas lacunae]BAV05085.1 internalin [Filimonas lacunae]SIT34247.1 C-terminal of Roc, COR, domain [Filimonas lacunae]